MSPRSVVAALKMDLKAFSRIAGEGAVPLLFDANQKNNLNPGFLTAEFCGGTGLFDFLCCGWSYETGLKAGYFLRILNGSKAHFTSSPNNESGDMNLQGENTRWLETSQRVSNRVAGIDCHTTPASPTSSHPHGTVQLSSEGVKTRRSKPARRAKGSKPKPSSLDRSHPFQAHAITLAVGHHL